MKILFESLPLLKWFEENKKEYPWSKNPTPYRVWISEIMLQQTVVTAVVSYFNRWMERFPGVGELAGAEEPEVLRLWEGLGYYSRARNILKAAGVIVRDFGGIFPEDEKGLLALPGIGSYTASAILSMALGRAVPVLDANVIRIMQRLLKVEEVGEKDKKNFRLLLEGVIPHDRPGDFNGALMQLGQILCRPRNPLCLTCPINRWCKAYAAGVQDTIPGIKKKEKILLSTTLYLPVRKNKVLISPVNKGRFKGLHLFLRKEPDDLKTLNITPHPLKKRIHYYTKYKDQLEPLLYDLKDKNISSDGVWVLLSDLENLPMPSVYRKIARELMEIKERKLTG